MSHARSSRKFLLSILCSTTACVATIGAPSAHNRVPDADAIGPVHSPCCTRPLPVVAIQWTQLLACYADSVRRQVFQAVEARRWRAEITSSQQTALYLLHRAYADTDYARQAPSPSSRSSISSSRPSACSFSPRSSSRCSSPASRTYPCRMARSRAAARRVCSFPRKRALPRPLASPPSPRRAASTALSAPRRDRGCTRPSRLLGHRPQRPRRSPLRRRRAKVVRRRSPSTRRGARCSRGCAVSRHTSGHQRVSPSRSSPYVPPSPHARVC